MMERGLAVAFCPSDCCTDVSEDAGTDETLDGEDKLHRRDLLRAIDFYITVLAMASHDLRQPLQVIVGAHELLARRLTARPAPSSRKSWTSWSTRCSFTNTPGASNRSRFASSLFCSASRYSSTDRRGARGSISDFCRRAP